MSKEIWVQLYEQAEEENPHLEYGCDELDTITDASYDEYFRHYADNLRQERKHGN